MSAWWKSLDVAEKAGATGFAVFVVWIVLGWMLG